MLELKPRPAPASSGEPDGATHRELLAEAMLECRVRVPLALVAVTRFLRLVLGGRPR